MLAHLLLAQPGLSVCLEVYGDTAVIDNQMPVMIEEAKSRISEDNPVSDRAPDLWRTLYNWLMLARRQTIDPKTIRFRIHTSKEYSGHVVHQFNRADDRTSASKALSYALEQFSVGHEVPPSLEKFVTAISHADDDEMLSIIENFEYTSGNGRSLDAIITELRRTAVPDEHVDAVCTSLLGWVKRCTDKLIENGQPAIIEYDDFNRELVALVRRLDRSQILQSLAPRPKSVEVETHLAMRVYIRQLDLIDETDDTKLRAVHQYLQAAADRVQWAASALVHAKSFDDLEEALVAACNSYTKRIQIRDRDRDEVERGQLLWSECALHSCRVQGFDTPLHFIPGCFHALADKMEVGWHPRYRELLDSEEST